MCIAIYLSVLCIHTCIYWYVRWCVHAGMCGGSILVCAGVEYWCVGGSILVCGGSILVCGG